MREVFSRSFYCPRVKDTVTLIQYARGDGPCRGILSCSHQDRCCLADEQGRPVHPWGDCPACPRQD